MRFPSLSGREVVLDLETTGLKWWKEKVIGVVVVIISRGGVDKPHYFKTEDLRDDVGTWLRREVPKAKVIIGHNLKFDMHYLHDRGIHPTDWWCTMVAAALVNEHEREYSLDYLGRKYKEMSKDDTVYEWLAEHYGGKPTKKGQGHRLHLLPDDLLAKYAIQDGMVTAAIWTYYKARIREDDLERVMDLEMKLLYRLMKMEKLGVRVDVKAANRAVFKVSDLIEEKQNELNKLAGFEVNPNPSKSIHQLFNPVEVGEGQWKVRDGTIIGSTPAGKPSIDANALRTMADPCAKLIIDLRKYKRVRDTFIEGHILGHHEDGVVHANFNQTRSENDAGTGTGRLSVTDPALQQIHKRDSELAAIVRSLFIPHNPDQIWVCYDWDQMDFRCGAHYIKDPRVDEAYASDPSTDFHGLVADITGLPRSPRFAGDANAKQINLGLLFGMGAGKLCSEMGLPFRTETGRGGKVYLAPGEEGQAIFDKYHGHFSRFRAFLKKANNLAKSRGYVRTITGRRIRFPGGQFTHKAGGLVFQGTAADCLKMKIIELFDFYESEGEQLTLNVHDEFDGSVTKGRDTIIEEGRRILQDFPQLRVPIRSGFGTGANWYEASK